VTIHFNRNRKKALVTGIPPAEEHSDILDLAGLEEGETITIETDDDDGNDFLIDRDGMLFELVPAEDLETEENADLDKLLAALLEEDEEEDEDEDGQVPA
jgi:hypothetical protein